MALWGMLHNTKLWSQLWILNWLIWVIIIIWLIGSLKGGSLPTFRFIRTNLHKTVLHLRIQRTLSDSVTDGGCIMGLCKVVHFFIDILFIALLAAKVKLLFYERRNYSWWIKITKNRASSETTVLGAVKIIRCVTSLVQLLPFKLFLVIWGARSERALTIDHKFVSRMFVLHCSKEIK